MNPIEFQDTVPFAEGTFSIALYLQRKLFPRTLFNMVVFSLTLALTAGGTQGRYFGLVFLGSFVFLLFFWFFCMYWQIKYERRWEKPVHQGDFTYLIDYEKEEVAIQNPSYTYRIKFWRFTGMYQVCGFLWLEVGQINPFGIRAKAFPSPEEFRRFRQAIKEAIRKNSLRHLRSNLVKTQTNLPS